MADQYSGVMEQYEILGQELLANGFEMINRIRNQQKVSKEEQVAQEEAFKEFRKLTIVINALKKAGVVKAGENASEEFDKGFIEKLRKKQSTVGSIVADIKQS